MSTPNKANKTQETTPDSNQETTQQKASRPAATMKAVAPTGTGTPITPSSSPPAAETHMNIHMMNDVLTNMKLAHEIAVDPEFKLIPRKRKSETTLFDRVNKTMRTAFWNVHAEKLNQLPPDYTPILELLKEVRTKIEDLLPPHVKKYRAEFCERLDMDIVAQQIKQGTIDVKEYSDYIIKVLGELCAPARDDQVNGIKEKTDIIELFKAVFETIDNMKLDMANYTLGEIRPFIQQQSREYESAKFKEYLKLLEVMPLNGKIPDDGLDGLLLTKKWLINGNNSVINEDPETKDMTYKERFSLSLHRSYVMLLQGSIIPETLNMDIDRIKGLTNSKKWVTLAATLVNIVMTSQLMYRKVIRMDTEIGGRDNHSVLKKTLLTNLEIVVKPEEFACNKTDCGLRLVEQLMKDLDAPPPVNQARTDANTPPPSDQLREDANLLRGQLVRAVNDTTDQSVNKILSRRIDTFLQEQLAIGDDKALPVPPGLVCVLNQFSRLVKAFLRLAHHNASIHRELYADLFDNYIVGGKLVETRHPLPSPVESVQSTPVKSPPSPAPTVPAAPVTAETKRSVDLMNHLMSLSSLDNIAARSNASAAPAPSRPKPAAVVKPAVAKAVVKAHPASTSRHASTKVGKSASSPPLNVKVASSKDAKSTPSKKHADRK